MLKKAGIVVAVAAAGALAVAPLAFAGEPTHSKTSTSPSCTFANKSDARTGAQGASGVASPLLGLGGIAANTAAPVTAQTNAPVLSCNNVSDVLDVNSNNKTKTVDNSKTVTDTKTINKESTSSVTSFLSLLGL